MMGDNCGALERLARSKALRARAASVDATVAPSGWILHRDRVIEDAYPTFVASGTGPRLVDVDGNRYLDFGMASGLVVLGHADPRVTAAVMEELEAGQALGFRKTVQVRLAELLVEVVPEAERVLLLKTGSDATSAAVRLARAFTGRDHVIRWGYHGWHDWAAWATAGVPAAERALVHEFVYGDLESLGDVFDRYRGEVACCIMMPFELEAPSPRFLHEVAELCREYDALFILDEMRSGFRISLGGAQEWFGVQADLVTFSKAIGNGYPISAVVGRECILAQLKNVHVSSSYFLGAAEMAAAVTTIGILRESDALVHIREMGERFQDGLRRLVRENSVPAEVLGYPQMPFLRFKHPDPTVSARWRDAFFGEAARRGVLLHPHQHWYICAALTSADVDAALAVCASAIDHAKRQLEG